MEITEQELTDTYIIRKYLVNYIRSNQKYYYTTYQELVDGCNLKEYANLNKKPAMRKQLGKILAYLLIEEHKAKRPVITSVIYGSKLYRPRNGFYITLCREKIKGTENKTFTQIYQDKSYRRTFETKAVEFWRNDVNFNKFKIELSLI